MVRQSGGKDLFFILIFAVIAITVTVFIVNSNSGKNQAEEAVVEFYTYEQDGAFSDSWAMFHPLMQEKFSKGHYLQDRAHVFMNHFGVTTFTFSIGDVEEITSWKMEDEAEAIDTVYKVEISQVFKGKYGNFTIVQDVFAAEFDGEWRVLWDYNK